MTFEQSILDHCKGLIAWDRDYAATAIQWYFKTCPWLEPLIGAQLRKEWSATMDRAVSSPAQRESSA